MSVCELLERIEELSEIMHNLGITKGISHPDVLLISQQLDSLLNEHYRHKFKLIK